MTQTKLKIQELTPNVIVSLLYSNFSGLMGGFYEMQSNFLTGLIKKYKSIETANIVLCFVRDTHLEILRLRERLILRQTSKGYSI